MRTLMVTTAALAVALAASAFSADTAHAHTPNPAACEAAWQAAQDGHRFAAKQRCIAAQVRHRCITHPRTVPGTVTVKGQYLRRGEGQRYSPHWRNQRKVIAWIVNEAVKRKLPRPVLISAIATTTQEASARELTYGHSSSLGPFQLLNIHGTPQQRISISFSGSWFINGAIRIWRKHRGRIGIVALSDAVQRPRWHGKPARWVREATRTTNIVLGGCVLPAR